MTTDTVILAAAWIHQPALSARPACTLLIVAGKRRSRWKRRCRATMQVHAIRSGLRGLAKGLKGRGSARQHDILIELTS